MANSRTRIVFGLVTPSPGSDLGARVERLLAWMGDHVGADVERRDAPSYEGLAADVREGRIDVAWLPPIVYVRLGDACEALGSILRGGHAAYEAALVVRADSRIRSIEALAGTRAGWVDPWSAAGFVLPRVKLALLGVDPRTLFRTERFYGAHRAAIEALASGACDAVGTYARATAEGASGASGADISGSWTEVNAEVRVLATFGAIPPDVIGVRRGVSEAARDAILGALRAACTNDAAQPLVSDVFGGATLREGPASGYDSLKSALSMATARGLFD